MTAQTAQADVIDKKPGDELCKKVFDKAYEAIKKELEFRKEWSNGTGLYDYAVYGSEAPIVSPGMIVKSITPGGRKLIIVGTRLGNVVVFERTVVHGQETRVRYCYQATTNFNHGGWFFDMYLDNYDLEVALGTEREPDIGKRLELIFSAMKKYQPG